MRLLRGLLGWSNKRTGLEFYRYDPKVIPRHGSEWGDLLVFDEQLGGGRPGAAAIGVGAEGCPVIVIVCERGASEEDLLWIEDQVRPVLEDMRKW